MANYKLNNIAKDDLIRIYLYGAKKFGTQQADSYYNSFFKCFEAIAKNPFSFKAVDYIRIGYRRCVCGVDNIYFRINSNNIEIMMIIGRQDLKKIS